MAHVYGSSAVLKSTRDCPMLGSSMRRVGLIDIKVGDAPRRIATFRHATLRVAPHRYATPEPPGKPGGSRAFGADGPPLRALNHGKPNSGDRARAQAQQSLQDCAMTLPGFDADDVAENRGRSFHEMPPVSARTRVSCHLVPAGGCCRLWAQWRAA